ncbi:MAG: hypothetical protein ACK5Q6_07485 [Cyanobacteriota bacterium]
MPTFLTGLLNAPSLHDAIGYTTAGKTRHALWGDFPRLGHLRFKGRQAHRLDDRPNAHGSDPQGHGSQELATEGQSP